MADSISASPRNRLLGLLADSVQGASDFASKPFGYDNPPVQGLLSLLGVPAVANTLNEMSYGGALGTGSGMTWKPKADTVDAAMAVAPGAMKLPGAINSGAAAVGRRIEPAVESLVNKTMQGGGMPAQLLSDMSQGTTSNIDRVIRFGDVGFDHRFDTRKLEQKRLNNLTTKVDVPTLESPPVANIGDYEGHPAIFTMADRSGYGLLTEVNGTTYKNPVKLDAGKSFMFNNPYVWSSAAKPVRDIYEMAHYGRMYTGKDPVILPWTMAPGGSDFASMTGNTMMQYANSAMGPEGRGAVNAFVKKYIPDWVGIEDPASMAQFSGAKASVRKAIQNGLDKNFRNDGGMSLGEARLAIADPSLLNARDGSITHMGRIDHFDPTQPLTQSTHPDYPNAVHGEGIGILKGDHNVYEYLQDQGHNRDVTNPRKPLARDLRALQMKPYGALIDRGLLDYLGVK